MAHLFFCSIQPMIFPFTVQSIFLCWLNGCRFLSLSLIELNGKVKSWWDNLIFQGSRHWKSSLLDSKDKLLCTVPIRVELIVKKIYNIMKRENDCIHRWFWRKFSFSFCSSREQWKRYYYLQRCMILHEGQQLKWNDQERRDQDGWAKKARKRTQYETDGKIPWVIHINPATFS